MAAGFSMSLRGDTRAMTRDLTRIQRRIAPRVTVRSLNRAIAKVNTQSVREISKTKGIKQKVIRSRMKIGKASPRRHTSTLTAKVYGVRASDIGVPRQTAMGTRVGRHQFPRAFPATMPSGHLGVFKRRGRLRLPIVEQRVPLQPEATRIIKRHVRVTGGPAFKAEFQRLMAVELRRRG